MNIAKKIPKLLGFLDFCRYSLGLLIIAKMRAPKRKAARSNRAGDARKEYPVLAAGYTSIPCI